MKTPRERKDKELRAGFSLSPNEMARTVRTSFKFQIHLNKLDDNKNVDFCIVLFKKIIGQGKRTHT